MNSSTKYPLVQLAEVLTQDQSYITELEARAYPKLSVKLYGRGVTLDAPADGNAVRMTRHQLAKAGQVILSEIWAKKGAIGIVPPAGAGALVTSHFFLFDILEQKLSPLYMKWLLQANYFARHLDSEARGTTGYAAIRPKQFLALAIPLPSLPEQQRIVARIEALAGKIEAARGLRREAAEESGQVIHAVMRNMFRSAGWDEYPLGSLLVEDSLNGYSGPPSTDSSGTPILRISAGTSRADALVEETDYKYADIPTHLVAKFALLPGDLLGCRFNGNLRYVGRFSQYTGYLGINHTFPDKLIRFRVDQKRVLPDFVRWFMNSPIGRNRIESFCATTAGNIGISASNLKRVSLPVPPVGAQEEIVASLGSLMEKLVAIRAQQVTTDSELNALLPAILDRAFKGEL